MTLADALQTTLEAEHAAVYVYGVLGARTSASADPQLYGDLVAGYSAHRGRRDQLRTMLHDLGETPVAAEPALAPLNAADARPGDPGGARDRGVAAPRRTPGWWRTPSATIGCGR